MFTHAIVRKPGRSLVKGITEAKLGVPDYNKAVIQHAAYTETLRDCGLEVIIMEADEDYPDSVFIEDTVVLTPRCAIITNPGAPSRRGETGKVKEVVGEYYDEIEYIRPPGTLDGGDVMEADGHYYIGLSERTNKSGAVQLIDILEKHGMTGSTIEPGELLHLKTGISCLGNNNLLAVNELSSHPQFRKFNIIQVPDHERYAANCIQVNDIVITPAGYPETRQKIIDAGYETDAVEMSEFRKLDGGVSCLSLRFHLPH